MHGEKNDRGAEKAPPPPNGIRGKGKKEDLDCEALISCMKH